jgi:hypothetical protein
VRALFSFYAFFFFLFNDLKRERVKRGRNGAEGKRGESEEKTGSVEDGVFSRINDLAANRAEILGFLDMPVPTWKTARRSPAGRSIAGFPAAVDELRVGRQRRNRGSLTGEAWFTWAGQRRRPSIEAHVDELGRPTRAARSRARAALPYSAARSTRARDAGAIAAALPCPPACIAR